MSSRSRIVVLVLVLVLVRRPKRERERVHPDGGGPVDGRGFSFGREEAVAPLLLVRGDEPPSDEAEEPVVVGQDGHSLQRQGHVSNSISSAHKHAPAHTSAVHRERVNERKRTRSSIVGARVPCTFASSFAMLILWVVTGAMGSSTKHKDRRGRAQRQTEAGWVAPQRQQGEGWENDNDQPPPRFMRTSTALRHSGARAERVRPR